MRHETCLTCRVPGVIDPNARQLILITESIAGPGFTHHHHLVECGGCGQWWFDDMVMGGLGIIVPSRRDTGFCECDESLKQYVPHVINVPVPESQCACTKALVDEFRLPIYVGSGNPTAHHEVSVPRAEAVRDIAAHIADRDAFIVSAPPDATARVAHALRNRRASGAVCYFDYGMPGVIRVRSPHLGEAADMARSQPPGTLAAVFIVPKTVPAARLGKLLWQDIPADGSQDLVMVQTRDLFDLTTLLLDAIGKLDPKFAAAFYANAVQSQS
jgi:hypothetical protein